MSATSERSYEQRIEALGYANEVRSLRAQMKRDLKSGRLSVLSLLADPPAWLASARVADVLLAVPMCGRVKVNRVLKRADLSPSKTIGRMSERQRRVLSSVMGAGG